MSGAFALPSASRTGSASSAESASAVESAPSADDAPSAGAGERLERLELAAVWLVDPAADREGRARLVIAEGRLQSLEWLEGVGPAPSLACLPALTDLHTHIDDLTDGDGETLASALAAAARGGFSSITVMPDVASVVDSAAAVARARAAAEAPGSPIRAGFASALTRDRAGSNLAPLAAVAGAGVVFCTDDPSPVADPELLRAGLVDAGTLGMTVVDHAEDAALARGAEAHEGLVATILGLHGTPRAAEAAGIARDLALLREALAERPPDSRPRLHVAHVTTADGVALIRAAKSEGLPVTCDVTPHHLALHDGWIAGDRRFAWEAAAQPWSGGRVESEPFDPGTRVEPPLREPRDALALLAGLADGTVDAIATDHRPRTEVETAVEFGDVAPGISGLETALSLVLAAVDSGALELMTAVRALSFGAAAGSFRVGAPAELVLVDRSGTWTVGDHAWRSRGRNTPLLGRTLRGVVRLTVAGGRVALRG